MVEPWPLRSEIKKVPKFWATLEVGCKLNQLQDLQFNHLLDKKTESVYLFLKQHFVDSGYGHSAVVDEERRMWIYGYGGALTYEKCYIHDWHNQIDSILYRKKST